MNELFKNSTRLLSANMIAQAIGLLVYPILTRIYTPEDFGLLNLMLSISSILVLLSTGEYQYAQVLAPTERKAQAAMKCSLWILLVMTALVVCSVSCRKPIAHLCKTSEIEEFWWIMPILVFVSGFWTILNYHWTRQKDFKHISSYQIIQSSVTSVSKIGMGVAGWTASGLIISTLIGPMVGIVSTCRGWWKELKNITTIPSLEVRDVAHEYKNLPCFSLPRALVNNLSNSAPALLLTPFFGTFELGFFAMAITLAFRPINMIICSIYQVLFQHITELFHNKQPIFGFIKRFVAKEMVVVLLFFLALYFILPWLCGFLLGEEWTLCGQYIRWMLPWLALTCINGIFCFLADIFNKQKIGFVFEIIILLARVAGLSYGIVTKSFENAVIGFSIMSAAALLCQLIWFVRLVQRYELSLRQ